NWQAYSGESTMSYFTQMAGLAYHNFTSAADGNDGSLRNHAVARFPRGEIVKRNLRAALKRCIQIHHYQRSHEAPRRNLPGGPSPGNKRSGSDDAGSG